jgi:hypothetical protein
MRVSGSVVVASIAVIFASVLAASELPTLLQTTLALPLVLVLPGYAGARAIFAGAKLAGAELAVMSVALSIATVVVGGFLLWGAGVGLGRPAWAGLLGGTTLMAAIVWNRRGDASVVATRPFRVSRREIVIVLLVLAVAGGSLGLARKALPARGLEGYTALWADPRGSHRTIQVGVLSEQTKSISFWLDVRLDGRRVLGRRLVLQPGHSWQTTVRAPVGTTPRRLVATLYIPGNTSPYRRVDVRLAGDA